VKIDKNKPFAALPLISWRFASGHFYQFSKGNYGK